MANRLTNNTVAEVRPPTRSGGASKDEGPGAPAWILRGPLRGHLRMRSGQARLFSRRDRARALQRTARKFRLQIKEGGGAPTGASSNQSAPHSQTLPSESAAGALASRRSAAVLAAQINATAQPRPRFARTGGCGRYPHHRSRSQRCTSRAGHSAGRSMPKPPGSGVTSPARRNRTRPTSRLSPVTSLNGRDCSDVA